MIKTELVRNKNKKNGLLEEASIILRLNQMGCPCVPKLLDFGADRKGRAYLVLQRIFPAAQSAAPEDIYLSYLAVRGCGWEHGDICPRNVIFDGRIAWLIDFDQTFPAEDDIAWSKGFYDDATANAFAELAARPFDLGDTALATAGRSTATPRGIYHTFSQDIKGGRPLFIAGERGIDARRDALKEIDFTGERILDVGCNTGALSRYLVAERGASAVEGIDQCAPHATLGQMVNCAAGMPNVRLHHRKAGEHEIALGGFDTTLLFSVFHHLKRPAAAAAEIGASSRRILIEARLTENQKAPHAGPWAFPNVESMVHHILTMFPGFTFTRNYGQGDRDRFILEFTK